MHGENVCRVLRALYDYVRDEIDAWKECIHPDIKPIVIRRCVPFCREFSFMIHFIDVPFWAHDVQGLSMTGWALPSFSLPPKVTLLSSNVLLDGVDQAAFRHRPNDGDNLLAPIEKHDGRDASDLAEQEQEPAAA